MDWAQDNAKLSDKDLDNVFKYEEKSTTVVRILSHGQKPIVWSLENKNEWGEWLSKELPRADGNASGLVLILAKRTGEPSFASVKNVSSDDWLERISKSVPGRAKPQRTMTFATMGEKLPTASPSPQTKNFGRRSVRTLPFSKATFGRITKDFYIHKSIARVISRADVPVFFSAGVKMEGDNGKTYPAYGDLLDKNRLMRIKD